MNIKPLTGFLSAGIMLLCPLAGILASEGESAKLSDRLFTILHTGESAFWSTAEGNVLDIPLRFPHGAKSAVLRVEGVGYSKVYSGIADATCRIVLPEAVDESTENLFNLTLEFDDGTVERASFALPAGCTSSNEAVVACRLNYPSTSFFRVRGRALIALADGARSLSVNGENVYSSTGGEWAWHMLHPVVNGARYALSFADSDGNLIEREIVGRNKTFAVIIK
jgi:hypothetical protein